MIKKLYPGGKKKAFNITYDDGVEQDLRFVELLNRYGMKGTFNLNSELMKNGFTWTHPNGMAIKRLPPETVTALYQGHEVACHTLTHPYLEGMPREKVLWELGMDRYYLQELFGQEICGFAAPFDYYSDMIADCVRECGFSYARISEESGGYTPGGDLFWQKAGIFHLSAGLDAYIEGFLATEEELAFGQIVGHSYDLDAENMWEHMERILGRLHADAAVLPMTHLEAIRYWQAMEQAQVTEEDIYNGSDKTLWFDCGGEVVVVEPGEVWKKQK